MKTILALAILMFVSVGAVAQSRVEATFDNRTGYAVDFYTDGHYSCRALANLTCNSMELKANHLFEAKINGEVKSTKSAPLQEWADLGYIWLLCVAGRTCPAGAN
jgi:hypothetical protein